jgi:hypothetical protein
VNEGDVIQLSKMMEKIEKVYFRRVRIMLKSERNTANRFETN